MNNEKRKMDNDEFVKSSHPCESIASDGLYLFEYTGFRIKSGMTGRRDQAGRNLQPATNNILPAMRRRMRPEDRAS